MIQKVWGKIYNIIPDFIKKNFIRKLIAIIFAVLVYIKISSEIDTKKLINQVPIEIKTPKNIEVIDYKPKKVDVTISGAKKDIDLINSSDINIIIPLREILNGNSSNVSNKFNNIELKNKYIKLPDRVSLNSFATQHITVYCDKSISKKVKVIPIFEGITPFKYKKEKIEIIPSAVTLEGPEILLNDIDSILTKPIGIRETKSTNYKLTKDKDLEDINENIRKIPDEVRIKIHLKKE